MLCMKSLASLMIASSLLAFGCDNTSKLDSTVSGGGGGDLEARIAKLEAENAKNREAMDFLQKVYNGQKQQQQQQAQQQEEQEPDPNAQFAVDITPDVKGGQVDGPAGACVPIVEAWDFA
jgi:hypothetical protein